MTEVLHSSSSSSSPSISTPTDNGTLFQSFLRRREEEEEEIIARITGSEGESEEEGGEVKEKENKERRDHQLSLLAFLVTLIRKSFWMACKTTTGGGGREELGGRVGVAAGGMEIGWPTNVRHVAHVTFDRFNGFLGLPVEFEPEVPRRAPSARYILSFFFLPVEFEPEVPRRAPSASATVFGVSTESMQLSFDSRGNSIPTILLLMQGRLYAQGGLQAEGIFRINAENSQEEYVRDQLNGGTVPEGIDVHCLAGLIKAWFRELPRGVLDPISPEQIMQCQTMEDCAALVRLLPPSEAALLDWAINLMADVVQLEHLNKMNSRNIAMVFAPNMTQMADPLTALMYAVQVMNFLKTLIEKTLRDREDSVVEQASMFHREPYDENGHQSPEVCVEDATESNEEPEPLFVAGEPEPDSASECQQVDNISVAEYVSSSTSPEECSDESVSSGTPVGPYTATNLASGPRTDIKESIPESRTGQSSDSIQMNCTKRTEEQHMVALAIGVQNKSKGISNLSRINSLTERIEAWR